MDYLQYYFEKKLLRIASIFSVLNLIINGLPSILYGLNRVEAEKIACFKPYYKWITFNTYCLKKEVKPAEAIRF